MLPIRPRPPGIDAEVVVWGDDAGLHQWLREHGIRSRPVFREPPRTGGN